ncbi:MAG: beta-glucosidase [Oscillospiraceae bacterium]|nr:beta-glucosidase [Oscillospiraceae bacterium]
MTFPKDFIWGAASSAYQIEGHATADGGGRSIWDTFCHTPGKILYDDHGDIACDAYHRYAEDIALLKEMGAKAYRFSTSWARIEPGADGVWNESGLAYYDKVVDLCLASGITPYMTLYHWELPQTYEDKGGWRVRETAEAFGRFAGMMAAHFRGRVTHYFTLNEPQCTVSLGHETGVHAPGMKIDQAGQFGVLVNQLLAHGYAMRAIKTADPDAIVGIASTGRLCYPETDADIDAARAATFAVSDDDWTFTHHWLLDPICLGHFPEAEGTRLGALAKSVSAEDLAIIHTVPDILGYNIYNGHAVKFTASGFEYVERYPGFPRTALKWPVTPEVLDWGVRFLQERYGRPGYITENGLSCNDRIYLDGQVHDAERIDFLARYLAALERAIAHGADIRGYFQWSLTDNFEWNAGYGERFGLIYIDYPTGQRIPKDSFYWYQNVIRNGTISF